MNEAAVLKLESLGCSNPEVWINGVRYLPETEELEPSEPEPTAIAFNLKAFFDRVRGSLFHGSLSRSQVEGCELIIETCQHADLDPFIEQTAYLLATVYHETATTMQPLAEYSGRHKRYAPWYGRGHVQLTWEENYRKQQRKLGAMPYVQEHGIPYRVHDDRDLAMNPQTSALICVFGMRDGDFTGKGLDDYIEQGSVDYRNARRIVNGLDRAEQIAGYARTFEMAVREAVS